MNTRPSPHLFSLLEAYSHRVGVLVAAVAVSVLVGWALDQSLLKSMMPGRIAMNPMTAACFIASGAAVWILRSGGIGRHIRWVGFFAAAGVLAVALIRLRDEFTNNIGIDQMFFRSQLGNNRMAPSTAICFALTAIAMLLRDVRHRWCYRSAAFCTLVAGCIALLALSGYVYDVDAIASFGGFVPMAINTAVAFLALCLGILFGTADREPLRTVLSDSDGGFMVRRLLPAAFFIPLLVGWVLLRGVRENRYDTPFLVTLFTLSTTVLFVTLIWWIARMLHRLDTQRARAEDLLRESEAVYHSLVETLPQNIFRKDLAGRFTFGNRNFCRELGRPIEQIIGYTDFDFFSKALAERYREDDRRVAASGEPTDLVEEHVTPSGQKLYVQVMKTPVRDPQGNILGTQGIFWDVTARKLAEQELERKNRQLEESVKSERQALSALKEAHAELKQAQSQLVQSEKLASLGQMVAGVAHEINNPLSFVSNNVAVLQRDQRALIGLVELYGKGDATLKEHQASLHAEIRDFAEQVDLKYTLDNLHELLSRSREGLKRIQQIVKDLRDFARLDESDLHEVDLNDGIRSTVNIILGAAKRKQVQLEMELATLPHVTCYPAKINQVVMNLLANAIDASNPNTKVTVRTRRAGGQVQIEVQDQGSGIPAEIRDRIFDPFFTTKPPGEGTGLGLSISYGIVQAHNGSITVQSEPGKGTTFTVTLPLEQVTPPEPITTRLAT